MLNVTQNALKELFLNSVEIKTKYAKDSFSFLRFLIIYSGFWTIFLTSRTAP